MKALIYQGPKKVVVENINEPVKREKSILIEIQYCGICGSDKGIFSGTHPRAKEPLILGHELLGEVKENGEKFSVGDRVVAYPLLSCGKCLACRTGNAHVCNNLGLIGIDIDGGICERMYIDEDILFKVPEGVSDKAAVVIEPLAVLLRAVHQAKFNVGENACVVGAGPIGLLSGIVLRHAGASKVFISDILDERLEKAKELGFSTINSQTDDILQIIKDETDNEGCDYLFECSGSIAAAQMMTELTRVSGTIVMVSVHKSSAPVNLQAINFKEQTIIGTRVYTKEEFKTAVDLSLDLQKDLEKIVTHVLPLSKSDGVFDIIADPSEKSAKVIVDCQK